MISIASYLVNELGIETIQELPADKLAGLFLKVSAGYPMDVFPVDSRGNTNGRQIAWRILQLELSEMATRVSVDKNTTVKHLAKIFKFEINDFFDALNTGKSHPLLEAWLVNRSANRHEPTNRGAFLRSLAVLGVYRFHSNGLSFENSYTEIAKIANATGVFTEHNDHKKEISPAAIRHWRRYDIDRGNIDDNLLSNKDAAQLSHMFGLGKISNKNFKNSKCFQFWASYNRRTFLANGTALIYQMMMEGVDPYEVYPEEIRKTFYEKNS